MATTKSRRVKTSATKKGSTAKASSNGTARRSAEDFDKLAPKFRKHLSGGGTMRALKAEHGLTSDVPIREALARAGYDSKGAKLSLEPITGSGKALAKKVAAERKKGVAWYVLALRTGKTEAEVKSLLKANGFSALLTGRVYKAAAPKPKAKAKAGKSGN